MEMCQIMLLCLYMLLYSDGFAYAVCVKISSGLFFSGIISIAHILVLSVWFYECFKGLFKDAFMQGQLFSPQIYHTPCSIFISVNGLASHITEKLRQM